MKKENLNLLNGNATYMNYRAHYKLLTDSGVTTRSEENVITDLVNRLIQSLYKPDGELGFKVDPLRLQELDVNQEPINWGDLKVSEVYKDYDNSWVVIIDEAAPSWCPSFCAYIQKYMFWWGWNVIVETEW